MNAKALLAKVKTDGVKLISPKFTEATATVKMDIAAAFPLGKSSSTPKQPSQPSSSPDHNDPGYEFQIKDTAKAGLSVF